MVTETVSVPLVLFAIDVVVRLQLYWEPESHALLHAAKAGLIKKSITARNAIAKI